MSRSGYVDDYDQWQMIMYRGAVTQAIKGKRGQEFFKALLAALEAMPEKKLIADELEEAGAVCAIGALGKARGIDMTKLDPEDAVTVAKTFDIAESLAREIVFINDDEWSYNKETPEARWIRMRRYVKSQIRG